MGPRRWGRGGRTYLVAHDRLRREPRALAREVGVDREPHLPGDAWWGRESRHDNTRGQRFVVARHGERCPSREGVARAAC